MPIIFDLEVDYRYNQGKEVGREEGLEEGREVGLEEGLERGMLIEKIKTIKNMLQLGNLSVEMIANCVNVSEEFVLEIKKEMNLNDF